MHQSLVPLVPLVAQAPVLATTQTELRQVMCSEVQADLELLVREITVGRLRLSLVTRSTALLSVVVLVVEVLAALATTGHKIILTLPQLLTLAFQIQTLELAE